MTATTHGFSFGRAKISGLEPLLTTVWTSYPAQPLLALLHPALAAIGTSRTMSTRSKRFLFVVVLLLVIVTFLIGFYGLWLIWDDEYPV